MFWKMNIKFLVLICITFLFACSDSSVESVKLTNVQAKVTATPVSDALKDQYVKAEGWKIILPTGKESEKTEMLKEEMKATGKSAAITSYSYSPSKDFFTDEPFQSIGRGEYGTIRIAFITELRAKGKVFSYVFLVNRTKIDEESGKRIRTGPGFYFRYFDMDGDGIFETLHFGGKSEVLPEWIYE